MQLMPMSNVSGTVISIMPFAYTHILGSRENCLPSSLAASRPLSSFSRTRWNNQDASKHFPWRERRNSGEGWNGGQVCSHEAKMPHLYTTTWHERERYAWIFKTRMVLQLGKCSKLGGVRKKKHCVTYNLPYFSLPFPRDKDMREKKVW